MGGLKIEVEISTLIRRKALTATDNVAIFISSKQYAQHVTNYSQERGLREYEPLSTWEKLVL
jgi:hypothetical protein